MLLSTLARNAIDDLVTPGGVAKLLAAGKEESGTPPAGLRKRTSPELNFDYEGLDVFLVYVQQAGLPDEGSTLVMRRKGIAEWVLVGVRL